jgi:Protein of unknown function (DUF2934)
MSKAQRKTKAIKLVIAEDPSAIAAEDHRVITKDDVARRAYELFLARGGAEGHDVEDWLEAERQLEAESMAPSIEPTMAGDSPNQQPLGE